MAANRPRRTCTLKSQVSSSSKSEKALHSVGAPEEGSCDLDISGSDDESYNCSDADVYSDEDESDFKLRGCSSKKPRVPALKKQEMSDEMKEKRYEKLKYLLEKSIMLTHYLMKRINDQKEEEEKKIKERLMKITQTHKAEEQREGEDRALPLSDDWKSVQLMDECCDEATMGVIDNEAPTEELKQLESTEDEEFERCVLSNEGVPFFQPKLMEGGVLRQYQVDGYNWLKAHFENGVNGILADEMGLGKTVQCVALIAHLVYMGIPGPFLVCAPLSIIPHWFSEFKRFAPKVPTVLYHGSKAARFHLLNEIKQRHHIREGFLVQPVVITSYEIAMVDSYLLVGHKWKYLIMDEGHRIKNAQCRLIKELRMYQSTHRLLLTGTPLQNSLAELWTLLNFILPAIFDDLGSFETWFDVSCINNTEGNQQIVQQERAKNILAKLHQILTPFMLRRLKSDVDLQIPPKKEVLVFAPMTQQQTEFYSAVIDGTIFSKVKKAPVEEEKIEKTASGRPKRKSVSRSVDYALLMETDQEKRLNRSGKSGPLKRGWEEEQQDLEDWIQALSSKKACKDDQQKKTQRRSQVTIKLQNVMMELCKCCNHPYLLEHPLDAETGELAITEGIITASGKMLVLDKMLVELKKRGHKVLIFSQMTRMLDLIEDFCNIRNYDFCRLDGSTHVDDRSDSISDFNSSKSGKFLFLLSTKAGGLGINLIGADTVIIYDSSWNPQCDIQAQDRCHRIGQRKPVVVYRFVSAHTIDQKIIERASAKRKLEKMVIHKGKFKGGNLLAHKPISPEELQDLLKSKDHQSEVNGDTFTISQAVMNSLLDRSDILDKWRKMKNSVKDQRKLASTAARTSPVCKPAATTFSDESIKTSQSAQPECKLFKIVETEDPDSSSTDGKKAGVDYDQCPTQAGVDYDQCPTQAGVDYDQCPTQAGVDYDQCPTQAGVDYDQCPTQAGVDYDQCPTQAGVHYDQCPTQAGVDYDQCPTQAGVDYDQCPTQAGVDYDQCPTQAGVDYDQCPTQAGVDYDQCPTQAGVDYDQCPTQAGVDYDQCPTQAGVDYDQCPTHARTQVVPHITNLDISTSFTV